MMTRSYQTLHFLVNSTIPDRFLIPQSELKNSWIFFKFVEVSDYQEDVHSVSLNYINY